MEIYKYRLKLEFKGNGERGEKRIRNVASSFVNAL
jgi:hypothetical protein